MAGQEPQFFVNRGKEQRYDERGRGDRRVQRCARAAGTQRAALVRGSSAASEPVCPRRQWCRPPWRRVVVQTAAGRRLRRWGLALNHGARCSPGACAAANQRPAGQTLPAGDTAALHTRSPGHIAARCPPRAADSRWGEPWTRPRRARSSTPKVGASPPAPSAAWLTTSAHGRRSIVVAGSEGHDECSPATRPARNAAAHAASLAVMPPVPPLPTAPFVSPA